MFFSFFLCYRRQGFAPDQLLRDSLPKTTKQINVISEELMKVLLSLDGLSFSDAQKESRAKRKVLIDRINRMHDRPVVRDGEVVVRKMLYLSSSFDHRIIDGMVAARFKTALKGILEQPESLLLDMV